MPFSAFSGYSYQQQQENRYPLLHEDIHAGRQPIRQLKDNKRYLRLVSVAELSTQYE